MRKYYRFTLILPLLIPLYFFSLPHVASADDNDPSEIASRAVTGLTPGFPSTSPTWTTPVSQPIPATAQTSAVSPTTGRIIALDPGHSPSDPGASALLPDGTLLREQDLTLQVAFKTAALLRQAGYRVVMTRTADVDVNTNHLDLNGDGVFDFHDELQARIDLLNASGAELFVSMHFNGSTDSSLHGTEVYYNPERTFGADNHRLATLVLDSLYRSLVRAGYSSTVNRGLKLDTDFPGDDHLFLLGASNSLRIARESRLPGVLAEALFLTNPLDAAWLSQQTTLDALAAGYSTAISQYFAPVAP